MVTIKGILSVRRKVKGRQVPHGRVSKNGKSFRAGRGLMKANKGKSYVQLRNEFGIHPLKDSDGKRNYEDCKPWDKEKQDLDFDPGDEESFRPTGWEQFNLVEEEKTKGLFFGEKPDDSVHRFLRGEDKDLDI